MGTVKNDIVKFLKSYSFFKGILKSIAILSVVVVGYIFGELHLGLSAGLTILVIAPSDIPGEGKHHLLGLFIATFFTILAATSVNLAYNYHIILLIVVAVLVFMFAYISLYGLRATMVALAGIFMIALSFSRPLEGVQIVYSAFAMLLGGLWYIFLVWLLMLIKPRQYSEQLLANAMELTAKFFRIRASLVLHKGDQMLLKKQLLDIQIALNTDYENLRSVLLDTSSRTGKTNFLERQFLIFIELVDIFELAAANPMSHNKIENLPNMQKYFANYARFMELLSELLEAMSVYIGRGKETSALALIPALMAHYQDVENSYKDIACKNVQMEKMHLYLRHQLRNIGNLARIFENYYAPVNNFQQEKKFYHFVSKQSYSPKLLFAHFTLDSLFFRHALRLSIVSILGILIGEYFQLQNSFWILFTIYVIMRPGYATTKKRSYDRAWGSVIGLIIAFFIIYLTQHVFEYTYYKEVYFIVGVLCMPFAYGLLQENFALSAVFITIYIMLAYAIFSSDILEVLQYRFIDTMIGVGLSLLGNYFIFPLWQYKNYDVLIQKVLTANIDYLKELVKRVKKESSVTSYKLKRKAALLALANLNAGLQQMLQEPKSKQKKYLLLSEIAVLFHDFISCALSVGVALKTEEWLPESMFEKVITPTITRLKLTESILNNKPLKALEKPFIDTTDAENVLLLKFYKEQFSFLERTSNNIYTKVKIFIESKS